MHVCRARRSNQSSNDKVEEMRGIWDRESGPEAGAEEVGFRETLNLIRAIIKSNSGESEASKQDKSVDWDRSPGEYTS